MDKVWKVCSSCGGSGVKTAKDANGTIRMWPCPTCRGKRGWWEVTEKVST